MRHVPSPFANARPVFPDVVRTHLICPLQTSDGSHTLCYTVTGGRNLCCWWWREGLSGSTGDFPRGALPVSAQPRMSPASSPLPPRPRAPPRELHCGHAGPTRAALPSFHLLPPQGRLSCHLSLLDNPASASQGTAVPKGRPLACTTRVTHMPYRPIQRKRHPAHSGQLCMQREGWILDF